MPIVTYPSKKLITALAVLTLALLAVLVARLDLQGHQKASARALEQDITRLEHYTTQLAYAVSQFASQARNQTTSGDFLSAFMQPGAFDLPINSVYLILADGTYYRFNAGNPAQHYLITQDDTDAAARPASLLRTPIWHYYFGAERSLNWRLWLDPGQDSMLLLTLPVQTDIGIGRQLLAISLDPAQWLAVLGPDVNLAIVAQEQLIVAPSDRHNGASTIRTSTSWTGKELIFQRWHQTQPMRYLYLGLAVTALLTLVLKRLFTAHKRQNLGRTTQGRIVDGLQLIAFETDKATKVIWCQGELPTDFQLFRVEPGARLKDLFSQTPKLLTYLQQSLSGDSLTYELNDSGRFVRVHQAPIRSKDNQVIGLSIFIQEITELKNLEYQLDHQQFHDELTGLPNRQFFMEQLQQGFDKARQHQQPIALLAMEFSGIGRINKLFGHQIGDQMLQQISRSTQQSLPADVTLCRYSNDEFLLSTEVQPDDDIQLMAEQLIRIVSQPTQIAGNELSLSVNIGIALFPRDAKDSGSLISNAITAMRHARQTGRNTLDYFSVEEAKLVQQKWQLEQDLTLALQAHAFALHYQPIFDLRSNRCVGAEALIRWPGSQLVPEQFIPMAEQTGLIYRMGLWVLETAMQQLHQWRRESLAIDYISVNLSVKQLDDPDFFNQVDALLARYPLHDGEIILEVTESVLMNRDEATIAQFAQLRARGFHLALDDFGTGFSSLTYLKNLPINILKIDRSFVEGLPGNSHDTAICEAIIKMAVTMDLLLVAEGVETPMQMAWLQEQGVASAQGYFYAKAVSATDFLAYIPKTSTKPDR